MVPPNASGWVSKATATLASPGWTASALAFESEWGIPEAKLHSLDLSWVIGSA